MKEYYDARAPEYNDWYRGRGGYADRDRPGWDVELEELAQTIAVLSPGRTLDVSSPGTSTVISRCRSANDSSPRRAASHASW